MRRRVRFGDEGAGRNLKEEARVGSAFSSWIEDFIPLNGMTAVGVVGDINCLIEPKECRRWFVDNACPDLADAQAHNFRDWQDNYPFLP